MLIWIVIALAACNVVFAAIAFRRVFLAKPRTTEIAIGTGAPNGLASALMPGPRGHEPVEFRNAPMQLPVVQPAPVKRECGSCEHFDVELGQREMRRNPAFAAAMHTVPPWRMGRVLKHDENGDPLPMDQQGISARELALDWSDMGACTCPAQGEPTVRAKVDSCEHFAPKLKVVA